MKSSQYWESQERRWHDQWVDAQKQIDELESAISALELIALKHIDDDEVRNAIKKLVNSVFRGIR